MAGNRSESKYVYGIDRPWLAHAGGSMSATLEKACSGSKLGRTGQRTLRSAPYCMTLSASNTGCASTRSAPAATSSRTTDKPVSYDVSPQLPRGNPHTVIDIEPPQRALTCSTTARADLSGGAVAREMSGSQSCPSALLSSIRWLIPTAMASSSSLFTSASDDDICSCICAATPCICALAATCSMRSAGPLILMNAAPSEEASERR